MEDPERISNLVKPKTPLVVRVIRTALLTIFLSIAGVIGLAFWQAGQGGFRQVVPLIAALFILMFIPLLIWAVNCIRNERIIFYAVLILLILIVYGGVLSLGKEPDGFHFAVALAVILSIYFIFQKFSLWMVGFCFCFVTFCICWQGIPPFVALSQLEDGGASFGPSMGIGGNLILAFGCILIALAYIPRQIEWKRYFFPYRNRPFFDQYQKTKKGFTLIELLIAVAVIGIASAGILHSWTSIIRMQKEMQVRAHAIEILNSEMDALMSLSPLPAPSSSEAFSLPIQLQSFVTPYRFAGKYRLEKTDEQGIVKITVLLTQQINEVNDRHFRLIGYRRWKADQQP
ncbi:MAG: type II secretion system protein [Candidatus Omnitrophica bacterium]|nr:type II secretion system protein [Candidatus Omnitrophota bacterium]